MKLLTLNNDGTLVTMYDADGADCAAELEFTIVSSTATSVNFKFASLDVCGAQDLFDVDLNSQKTYTVKKKKNGKGKKKIKIERSWQCVTIWDGRRGRGLAWQSDRVFYFEVQRIFSSLSLSALFFFKAQIFLLPPLPH